MNCQSSGPPQDDKFEDFSKTVMQCSMARNKTVIYVLKLIIFFTEIMKRNDSHDQNEFFKNVKIIIFFVIILV